MKYKVISTSFYLKKQMYVAPGLDRDHLDEVIKDIYEETIVAIHDDWCDVLLGELRRLVERRV